MLKLLAALKTSARYSTLFHFTDRRNVPGIREHGLLSLRGLRQRGIAVPAPGGNDWSHDEDVRLELDDYVHLCLCDEHPMEYVAKNDGRIATSIFLKVRPDVLHREGTMFCDEVSNKKGAVIRPLAEIDAYLDHEVVYAKTDWKDPAVKARLLAARKFEILVPKHIGPDMLILPENG